MDISILEQQHSTRAGIDSGITFGRITAVYPQERKVEVKTFLGRGNRNDNHIPKCQWINLDLNPDGDASAVIPRTGAYGLVFYIDGEAFIFGFFAPITDTGSAFVGEDAEDLNEGDRIINTVFGNKIILRAHGEIQIQSTDTCRTIYFPDQNLINTLCRNYEFVADGGTVTWENIDDQNNTNYKAEYRDNISRANVVIVERGTISGEIISSVSIGPGSDSGIDSPTYRHTIKKSGEMELAIGAVHLLVKPDGSTNLTSGKTIIDIASGGAVKVTTTGKLEVKAQEVEIDGGSGDLEKALTTPSAISDFTGLPIEQGSSSVKLSGA